MVYTPEFFAKVRKRQGPPLNPVARFCHNPDRFRPYINQLNFLWSILPEGDEKNALLPRLQDFDVDNFNGAVAELLAYFVLNKLAEVEPVLGPKIGNQKPDFLLCRAGRSLYLETFATGSVKREQIFRTDFGARSRRF